MLKQPFDRILKRIVPIFCAVSMASAAPLTIFARQQAAGASPVPVISASQLDTLVSPVALYPDPLLSQVLVASTYPMELVEANQWLQKNPELSGAALVQAAAQQNWDPSIQALVVFPDVVKRLNEDITWTVNLGNAFLAQQADVMAAVQRMRLKAEQSGNLKTMPQMVVEDEVENDQPVIVISPPAPDVIYVPVYDPLWIWGPPVYWFYPHWVYPPRPVLGFTFAFGAGITMGGFFGGGWGGWPVWGWQPFWETGVIIISNGFVHRYNFNAGHLTALAGTSVWQHDPAHRLGVPYPNQTLTERYRAPARQNLRPGAILPAQPGERMGNRAVAPNEPNRNRSAFGSIENGANSTLHTDHGYSSLGPARTAPAPSPRPAAPVAPRPAAPSMPRPGGRPRGGR